MPQHHKIYKSIVSAVKNGKLTEPFNSKMVKKACPGFANATYGTFLPKHRRNNPMGTSQLFERVSPGKYRLIKPYKYGL